MEKARPLEPLDSLTQTIVNLPLTSLILGMGFGMFLGITDDTFKWRYTFLKILKAKLLTEKALKMSRL